MEEESNAFYWKTRAELPELWPRHANGSHVIHVYLLIDEDAGGDLRCPEIARAMRHSLIPGTTVNFSQKEAKEQTIKHVEALLPFGVSKKAHNLLGKRNPTTSFVNLSTYKDFDAYFKKGWNQHDYMPNRGIEYDFCWKASVCLRGR